MAAWIVSTYLFLLSLASLVPSATPQTSTAVAVYPSLQPFIEINSATISPSLISPVNYKLTSNAVEFSQKNGSYMDFGSRPLNLQSKGFSVSAVFEFYDTVGYQDIIFNFRANNGYDIVTLRRIDYSNQVAFTIQTLFGSILSDVLGKLPGLYEQNKVHRIGITVDSRTSSVFFFVNGVLMDSTIVTTSLSDLSLSQTLIAKSPSYPTCNIKVYSLKFYNGVLPPEGQYQDSLIRPLCNSRTSWNGISCVPFKTPFLQVNGSGISPPAGAPVTVSSRPTFQNDSVIFQRGTATNWLGATAISGQYLDFGAQTLYLGNRGFSVTVVFEFTGDSPGSFERIFDFGSGAGVDNVILTRILKYDEVGFWISAGPYDPLLFSYCSFPASIGQRTTYRIGVTFDPNVGTNGQISLYHNGYLVVTGEPAAKPQDRIVSNAYVGRSLWSNDDYPNMRIYSLNMYHGVLSPAQVFEDTWCKPGFTWNGTDCVSCLNGTYKALSGMQSCTKCVNFGTCNTTAVTSCQAGYTCDGTQCSPCASGTYKPLLGLQPCMPCPTGSVCNSTSISSCLTGYYLTTAGKCSPCASGTYKPLLGLQPCTPCPTGSACNSTSIISCQPGYFWNETRCNLCASGTYKPFLGLQPCSACPVGSSCNATATTSCKPGYWWNGVQCVGCESGTFKPLDGLQSCDICPAGSLCDAITIASCQSGSWWNGTQCINCASGTFKPQDGLQKCDTCPTGSLCNTTSITSCLPGSWWNDTQCVGCESGTFKTLDGFQSCDSCPIGSICDPMSVLSCQPGYTWNDTKCIPCSLEFIKPEAGLGACYSCPFNSICNSTSITGCIPGTFWTGSSCEPCLEGYDKTSDDFGPCNAMTIVSSMQIFDNTTAPSRTLVDKATVDVGTTSINSITSTSTSTSTTTTEMNPVLYQTGSTPYLTSNLTEVSSTAEYTETPTYSGSTNDNSASTTGELAPTTTEESGSGSTNTLILNGMMMPIAIGVASLVLIFGVGAVLYRLRTRSKTRKEPGGWLESMTRLNSNAGAMDSTSLYGTTILNSTSAISNGTTLAAPTSSGKAELSTLDSFSYHYHSILLSWFRGGHRGKTLCPTNSFGWWWNG